jgi:hypothetical protein
MGRLETAHQLDDGVEPWLIKHLRRGTYWGLGATAHWIRHCDGVEDDRPAGRHRNPIGILDQPSRQRPTDVPEAEQTNPVWRTHWGTLPSRP